MVHLREVRASNGRGLARMSMIGIAIRAVGATCGFLFNIILARTLGRAGTGGVMFYLNFATMMGLIATGGMDVVGLRELSRKADDPSRSSALLATLLASAAPSLLLFSIGGFLFLFQFGFSLAGAGNRWIYAICALMLCLTALQKILSDWLIALCEFVVSQLVFYFLNRVASLILITVALGSIAGMPVAAIFVCAYAGGLIVAVLYAIARISAHFSQGAAFLGRPRMSFLRDGISCAAQNAAFILLSLSPFLLLGALSTPSEIGLFGVSQRLVTVVVLALTAISQFAMRDFSRAFGNKDFLALARSVTTSMRLTFLAAIGLTIPLVFFAPFWVLIFGKPFAAASTTLMLLSAAVCAQCLGMPFQAVLLTTNNERLARDVTCVCAAIGIALNVVFIPLWGATGAAVGTGIGLALQSIGHALCALRILPLRFHFAMLAMVPRRTSLGII